MTARERDDLVALAEHAARARDDLRADLGELRMFRAALDELHAEIFLELLQLCGKRRLTDERALSGLAEMPGVGESDQIFEVFEIHAGFR